MPAPTSSAQAPFDSRVRAFRGLHEAGCFVMPNPWDIGSARALAQMGFPALATTSAGFAWSIGQADGAVDRDTMLTHFREMAGAVEVPVNADFESGFAVAPEGVAANVRLATATGVAGLSIEDATGETAAPLFDRALAIERVRAAREAIDASGTGVVLTARTEGFIVGRPDLDETMARLSAFAAAGADCLYAPGIRTAEQVAAVVAAAAPRPVNLLVNGDFITVAEAARLGVRRISVGGALARAAWTAMLAAAQEMAVGGTFHAITGGTSAPSLNGRFDRR